MNQYKNQNEFNAYYIQSYHDFKNLNALQEKVKEYPNVKKAVENFNIFESDHEYYARINGLKYYIRPRSSGYVVSTFDITRLQASPHNTTYAILYSYVENNKVIHDFVSISYTLNSADGEYRRNFIGFSNIIRVKNLSKSLFDKIEEHTIQELNTGKITMGFSCKSGNKQSEKLVYNAIKNSRITILFYICSWLIYFKITDSGILPNHVNPEYAPAMFSDEHNDLMLNVKTDYDEFVEYNIALLLSPVTHEFVNKKNFYGQKSILLSREEIESFMDIRYDTWRELAITKLATNLVINGVTTGLPVMKNWFINVRNDNSFDNFVNKLKIQHSDIAEEIIYELEKTRMKTKNKKDYYISLPLKNLSDRINVSMDYAEKYIYLSKYVLTVPMQHLGRTFGDIPNLLRFRWRRESYGPIFMQQKVFMKYLFEILFNLSALYDYYGVIHGDLHLNNICTFVNDINNNTFNNYTVYEIDNNIYIFKSQKRSAAIIDFSRSFILHPEKYLDIPEHRLSRVSKDIRNRAFRNLKFMFPEFVDENEDKIKMLMKKHFNQVYEILPVVDVWRSFSAILELLERDVIPNSNAELFADIPEIKSKFIPLLQNILEVVLLFMRKSFYDLFQDPNAKITNIHKHLIQHYFQEFHINNFTKTEEVFINQYYSTAFELKYSFKNPPAIIDLDTIFSKFKPTDSNEYYKTWKAYKKDKTWQKPGINTYKDLHKEILQERLNRREKYHQDYIMYPELNYKEKEEIDIQKIENDSSALFSSVSLF